MRPPDFHFFIPPTSNKFKEKLLRGALTQILLILASFQPILTIHSRDWLCVGVKYMNFIVLVEGASTFAKIACAHARKSTSGKTQIFVWESEKCEIMAQN